MGRAELLADAAFVGILAGIAATGAVVSGHVVPVLAVTEAEFAIGAFTALMAAAGARLVADLGDRGDVPPLDAPVTVVVPTYRDACVLHRSVTSALASTHDVRVVIVYEPDDEAGRERAAEFADHDDVTVLRNPNPGSKAGAINAAVEHADTDAFALLDADQVVDPEFVANTVGHLRDHDVVQARVAVRPTGLVESLVYDEYMLFNYTFRQLLYAVSDFRMATSKAMLFTREAFDIADGYDERVIAEDNDFAHQCYRAGLSVKLRHDALVTEESAHTFRDWWGQRKRWMTGNVQVLHGRFAALRADPWNPRTYVSLAVAAGSVLGSFVLLTLLPNLVYLVQDGRGLLASAPLLVLYGIAAAGRSLDGYLQHPHGWTWLLAPLLLPLFSIVTVRAFTEYLFAFDGSWFSVEKGDS